MLNDFGLLGQVSQTVDVFWNKDRYSFQGSELFNSPATLSTKTRLRIIQCQEISSLLKIKLDTSSQVKVTLALEKNQAIGLQDIPPNLINGQAGQENLIRKKRRTSFLPNPQSRIDLTDVVTIQGNKTSNGSEIEVELIGWPEDDMTGFLETVDWVNKLIQMAQVIGDYNEWITMEEEKPGHANYNFLSKGPSPDPRNLKKEDFVWSGLLGGPYQYSITVKGDGVRKNLVIHPSGIWLVRPKRGFPIMDKISPSLSCKCPKPSGQHSPLCPMSFIGTVLDGELFEHSNLDSTLLGDDFRIGKTFFFPFDCMSFRGNWQVQKLNHIPLPDHDPKQTRLYLIKLTGNMLNKTFPGSLRCHVKKFFRLGSTWEEMAQGINACALYIDQCGFDNDGYILTPINFRYKPILTKDSKVIVGPLRILSKSPDICKLKPWDKLSIDVVVKSVDGRVYVAGDKDPTQLVLFTGTARTPFGIENYILPPYLDRVVEMEPRIAEDGTFYLQFARLRDDKLANGNLIAQDVWKDINDPIYLESLLGLDFKFLRKAMNRIKMDILSKIEVGSNVLDIGSGNGGDLYKFEGRVSHLLAVDPNEENMNEFQRRVKVSNLTMGIRPEGKMSSCRGTDSCKATMKIETILGGGEESQRILEKARNFFDLSAPIVVTSMLSLSFFWSNLDTLIGLARTIAQVVKLSPRASQFIFYTIDGLQVANMFEEAGSDRVQLGPVRMHLDENNVLELDYPNSIVKKQTEYLVVIDDLVTLLGEELEGSHRVQFTGLKQPETETILSPDEMVMFSLYLNGQIDFFPLAGL